MFVTLSLSLSLSLFLSPSHFLKTEGNLTLHTRGWFENPPPSLGIENTTLAIPSYQDGHLPSERGKET